MAHYFVLHCPYDPDNPSMGYRLWHVEAESMEEAEKAGWNWIEERRHLTGVRHDKFEYRVIEVADDVGPRVYSTTQHKRL